MTTHTAVLIPGDGIGPEVSDAVLAVLDAAKAPVRFETHHAGQTALDLNLGNTLPETTLSAIRQHHVALKGPCTTPVGKGFSSVNVALRRTLNLYAAVRPIRNMPGVKTRYEGVDLVIVRENTEGLYSGIENQITDGVVVSMKVATRVACRRISEFTFRYANQRKRAKVSLFHKANIMKLSDGLMLEEARKVAATSPGITYEEVIIDAAQMRMVQEPRQFDIVMCENLYGDICSDLCAGLVGGLGVTPGANIGDDDAVFEAVHGSAPDIAGKNLANPLALLMSATMMLKHLADTRGDEACRTAGERIRRAYDSALEAGEKTRDIGGSLGTTEFARAVSARLGE